MSFRDIIRMLQAGAHTADAAEWRRKAARAAWGKEIAGALYAAQTMADAAWDRLMQALPEDATEEEVEAVQPPPEQAAVDAIHAQIDDMMERDKWPRHLYWGGI
jgi:hypothetical protein